MDLASKALDTSTYRFVGPFQGAMFLVAVDAFSKWPEVHIMGSTTVEKTIEVLRKMCAYGLPNQIVIEHGPYFLSTECSKFLKRSVKHTRIVPCHAASNGLAERFMQSLKHSLKATYRG